MHLLFEENKIVSCTLHTSAFVANSEILQKKKMNTQSAKMSQNAPFAPFFRKIPRRDPRAPPHPNCKGIFPNEPTPPHRSEVGLQPIPAVDIVSGSVTDNAMYIFL